MTQFSLQFPLDRTQELASRYSYSDDAEVIAHGARARERGYFTQTEFLDVCRWKSPRSKVLTVSNPADAIEAATREAVLGVDDRLRMSALRTLVVSRPRFTGHLCGERDDHATST
jgi:hypothetical protein